MTDQEVDQVLHMLSVTYPTMRVGSGAELWAKHLAPFQFDIALDAVDLWVRENDRPPVIANVVAECRQVMRRTADEAAETRGLGSDDRPPNPQQMHELMDATREMLRRQMANSTKHWHGGPDPCPVCGGINPQMRPA